MGGQAGRGSKESLMLIGESVVLRFMGVVKKNFGERIHTNGVGLSVMTRRLFLAARRGRSDSKPEKPCKKKKAGGSLQAEFKHSVEACCGAKEHWNDRTDSYAQCQNQIIKKPERKQNRTFRQNLRREGRTKRDKEPFLRDESIRPHRDKTKKTTGLTRKGRMRKGKRSIEEH